MDTNDEGVFGKIFEETSRLCTFEVEIERVDRGKEGEERDEKEEEMHFARWEHGFCPEGGK